MIYLDYSATTPVNKDVLDSYNKVCLEYVGNANSLHKLGRDSYHLMKAAEKQVAEILNVKPQEVIFTSGASESNNLALVGYLSKHKNRGNHILTTKFEHSSVIDTLNYLKKDGYVVEYIDILENGQINIKDLESKITEDTVLVSISQVNSEIGIIQNVNEIGILLKKYPKIAFHVDGTQAIGKIPVSLDYIDLYSFSAHKIYGLKGVGCLIKKNNIELEPIIHGGKSQTIYRSGTPVLPMYVSLAKALKIAISNIDEKYNYILKLNKKLRKNLETMNNVIINSNNNCIPHIVNFSVINIKPETLINALSEKNIYISTKTACSNSNISDSVLELTKDERLASSSIRVSLSHLTTEDEIEKFSKNLETIIEELTFNKGE